MSSAAPVRHRLAATAVAFILAIVGFQAAVTPAAALSLCSTSYCATLTVTASGPGSGTITSDDGNIDCVVTGGVTSGTCSERIIWAGTASVEVSTTATPAAEDYVCFESLSA